MTRSPALCSLALGLCGALCGTGCLDGFLGLLPGGPPLPVPATGVIALAGPDLVVLEGSRVALAGRASRSFTGDPSLSWSQVEGPPVLLTNPSSPLPVFTAPLAPARLRFQLRAEAADASADDQLVIDVVTAEDSGRPLPEAAGFIDAPGDTIAEPRSTHSFRVAALGNAGQATFVTRVSCGEGASTTVAQLAAATATVEVILPPTLPCAVIIDGVDEAGRGLAPAARIFWPPASAIPAATNLSLGQNLLEPGAELTLGIDDGARVWSAGGDDDVLADSAEDGSAAGNGSITFAVPRRAAHLVLAGEAIAAGASGGVEYEFLDVSAGTGNIAPVARGGPDRTVKPGARFRLATARSFDVDVDVIAVTTEQVLGQPAIADPLIGSAFLAPAQAGVLLFHVVADDGHVLSSADPVRVMVADDAENLAPLLTLPATRYAIPGQTFTLDGGSADDPDSGLIASVTIAQAADDLVKLLPEPVDSVQVELVAGAAGESYRFFISVYDDEGAGVTAEQLVIVEDAGPYIDASRGDDDSGNGTAIRPFASVVGALPTAMRHALPELRLAEGTHASIGGALPAGLSLRGGHVFDTNAAAYLSADGATTMLPISGEGLVLVDASARALTLALIAATGSIALHGSSALQAVSVVGTVEHTSPLVLVPSLAAARISAVELDPAGAAASPATVVVEAGASVRLRAVVVHGASGSDAVAISCVAAIISLDASSITGANGAELGTGDRPRAGCALDVTASSIAGGAAAQAIGIDAQASLLTTDAASTITGATAAADSAVAVRVSGRERSALLKSTLLASTALAATATGLECNDARVNLLSANIEARGAASTAVQADRCVLASQGVLLRADSAGVRGSLADDVTVVGGSIDGGSVAVDLDGDATRSFSHVVIRAAEVGVRAPDAFVEFDGVDIVVAGSSDSEPEAQVLGIEARGASLRDSVVVVSGAHARALVLLDLPSIIERTALKTTLSDSAALSHSGELSLLSSLLTSSDGPGIQSAGPLTLRYATILSGAAPALALLLGATLDSANSVVAGSPALSLVASGAPWLTASALALSSSGPLIEQPGGTVTTREQLESLGCEQCLVIDAAVLALLIDDDGHLAQGDNPLVDSGDDDMSLLDDIDGEQRPQGAGVDVGCDERAPPG